MKETVDGYDFTIKSVTHYEREIVQEEHPGHGNMLKPVGGREIKEVGKSMRAYHRTLLTLQYRMKWV